MLASGGGEDPPWFRVLAHEARALVSRPPSFREGLKLSLSDLSTQCYMHNAPFHRLDSFHLCMQDRLMSKTNHTGDSNMGHLLFIYVLDLFSALPRKGLGRLIIKAKINYKKTPNIKIE